MPTADAPEAIALPPGRHVELPGRGTTFIREAKGPRKAAPTAVLLHGLGVDADLNWFATYGPLAKRCNVVAIDHRGHGRGMATERFRLADCADDVAALCDVLGLERVVLVGYSMGGPIAQLTWHRHPDLVQGMVLCATAGRFVPARGGQVARRVLPGIATMARMSPITFRPNPIVRQLVASRMNDPGVREWALRRERRSDPRAVLEAAAAIGRFSSERWLPGVDVPTSVLITQFDRLVPRQRQERMHSLIHGATEHRVMGDHAVCATRPDLFIPALLAGVEAAGA